MNISHIYNIVNEPDFPNGCSFEQITDMRAFLNEKIRQLSELAQVENRKLLPLYKALLECTCLISSCESCSRMMPHFTRHCETLEKCEGRMLLVMTVGQKLSIQ